MAEGTVKWFNSERGYGFIAPDYGGSDVFVHYTAIQMTGYRTLDQDERVSFTIENGPKGPVAVQVTPLLMSGPPLTAPVATRDPLRHLFLSVLVTELVLFPGAFVMFVASIQRWIPVWPAGVVFGVAVVLAVATAVCARLRPY